MRKAALVLTLIWGAWGTQTVFSQERTEPLINEFMASNTASVQDEDGDFPDWLELYNPGTAPIDLRGYGLSDDPDDPFKWVFPHGILNPAQFLLFNTHH